MFHSLIIIANYQERKKSKNKNNIKKQQYNTIIKDKNETTNKYNSI